MSTIDEIKQRLDIVQVVSEYVALKKTGRNYKALCPFHSEKEPSFYVFPDRHSWHCFGACGTGGDIFAFVMRKEGLDFGQALRFLADKAGIALPSRPQLQDKAKDEQKDRLFQLNEAAAAYYHHMLLNASAGETARSYLAKRGLSTQTIIDFQLGFSLDAWDNALQYLTGKGYKKEELLAAGLLVERGEGGVYDRFRNRLMFPIRDIQGRVVGLGARILDESLPKYINSPQTPTFDKGSILYGIDKAKAVIKQNDQVIIVEGYMDVLTSHQYGWKNTVASMGTSLTERQLSILKRLTKNIVLALDADTAGKQATLRSEQVFEQAMDKKEIPVFAQLAGQSNFKQIPIIDANIRVAVFSAGKDPDEIIRSNATEWDRLIKDAKSFIDFAIDTETSRVELDNPKNKSLVVENLLPFFSRIIDPIQLTHYRRKLARLLKIDDKDIAYALDKYRTQQRKRETLKGKESPDATAKIASFLAGKFALEEYCMALLLKYPELRSRATELVPEYFERTENRELLLKLKENGGCDTIKENLDSSLHNYLESLLAKKFPPSIDESDNLKQQTMDDCILRLQEKWLRNLETTKAELLTMEAESGGPTAELTKLQEQGIEESKHLRNIFIKRGHNPTASAKEE
ncbi:MAG: DNA primase [Chloroflexi bacterium]|nr:DNA primase [Chloroflexota bacterium]MBM3172705.1 DNA primase [Chloroflexota bacterium]MBM3175485.1 DNA primase [Chloroflexota bacterium]MBM4450212.1 DNA primase [Chloroflexota bacterium]